MKINRDWAVGGGLFVGMGVGFFFLTSSPLYFIGSIFTGLGVGLILVSMGSKREKKKA